MADAGSAAATPATANGIAVASATPAPFPTILDHVNVAQINVAVPQSLRVSEANRYYPLSDIVWRKTRLGTVTRK